MDNKSFGSSDPRFASRNENFENTLKYASNEENVEGEAFKGIFSDLFVDDLASDQRLSCNSHMNLKGQFAQCLAGQDFLKVWFFQNVNKPYPSASDIKNLSELSGMEPQQIRNWFSNIRKRHWAPLKEGTQPKNSLSFIIKELGNMQPDKNTPNAQDFSFDFDSDSFEEF